MSFSICLFAIIVFVILRTRAKDKKEEAEFKKIVNARENRRNNIRKLGICKNDGKYYVVLNDDSLAIADWNNMGKKIEIKIDDKNDLSMYEEIGIEDNKRKEFKRINDTKDLIREMVQEIEPDIKKYESKLDNINSILRLTKKTNANSDKIAVIDRYHHLVEETYMQAKLLKEQYDQVIRDIFVNYEFEYFEKTITESILDDREEYKLMLKNIKNIYNEYIDQKNAYIELEKELNGSN